MAKKNAPDNSVEQQNETLIKYYSLTDGSEVQPTLEQKILKVLAHEHEYEGRKFLAYDVVKKNGDKLKLKFTKVAKNIPVIEGTHYLLVNNDSINIDTYSNIKPVMWCKNVNDIVKIENIETKEKKKQQLDEF